MQSNSDQVNSRFYEFGNFQILMNTEIGKLLVVISGLILAAGVIFIFFSDKLGWIGNLPGDIRIERENFRFSFPVTTMILISIVLSAVITIFAKLFRGG